MSVTRKKYVDMVPHIRDTARLTIEEAAIVVEGQAIQIAPVDTSTLEQSIGRKVLSPVEAEVGTTVDYAVYQEFGTRYVGAQPFLRPALDFLRGKLSRIWSDEAKRARTR